MNAAITELCYVLPKSKLTGEELSKRFGKEIVQKIERVSGILERRVANENVCASDLAFDAANLVFSSGKTSREQIDLLIFASQTPDYLMPSTACILQERLKLPNGIAAFDINLGCSQFPYALATAKAWIESGLAKKALILTADTPSKIIHPLDKSAVALFSDAAAACVVEASPTRSIADFDFGTDGSGAGDLIWETSALRRRPVASDCQEYEDDDKNIRTNMNMRINGFKIFTFAQKKVPQSISALLKKNSMSIGDVDLFIFHQAGEMMIKAAANKLGIPPNKIYYKLHDVGNCGGASVPIALADAILKGRVREGMKIVLCAFGVGLSWGSVLINWGNDFKLAATSADFSDSPARPKTQEC